MTFASNPTPRFPTAGTQAARILSGLLNGAEINPSGAWLRFGSYRLADVILQLRKLGWPVRTGERIAKNQFGEPCRFAEYHLERPDIDAAGAEGRAFAERECRAMASLRGRHGR